MYSSRYHSLQIIPGPSHCFSKVLLTVSPKLALETVFKKVRIMLGVEVCSSHTSTCKAKAGGLKVQQEPELSGETL